MASGHYLPLLLLDLLLLDEGVVHEQVGAWVLGQWLIWRKMLLPGVYQGFCKAFHGNV